MTFIFLSPSAVFEFEEIVVNSLARLNHGLSEM